jgi:dTDP-4-dehydrorhamnose reductase
MKLLILGGTGMLGHRLWSTFGPHYDVWATVRDHASKIPAIPGIDRSKILDLFDSNNLENLSVLLKNLRPDVVINCIGIIKQLDESKNHIISIGINSLFPHKLAELCYQNGIRMIHMSTDCVFDGATGQYNELDKANAVDLYGKTKLLGEVDYLPNVLTLRTSIIGREIRPKGSLVEWFLSLKGQKVQGYKNAIFSGLTTLALSQIFKNHIFPNPKLNGVYHVSSEPISKYDILEMTRDLFKLEIEIIPEEQMKVNRSLDSQKFRKETGHIPTPWPEMIKDLLVDDKFYQQIHH